MPEGQVAIQRPRQAQAGGPSESHEIQQLQTQGLARGLWQPHHQYKLGNVRIEHNPLKRTWEYWWMVGWTCTGETSPGVLCPDVESSVQERCGPAGSHPGEDHKNVASCSATHKGREIFLYRATENYVFILKVKSGCEAFLSVITA